jgi:tight adherence protein C
VEAHALTSMLVFLLVFFAVCGFSVALFNWASKDQRRAVTRLRQLSAEQGGALSARPPALPLDAALLKIGRLLLPRSEGRRDSLKQELIRAGFYSAAATRIFVGAKALLMLVLPLVCAGIPAALGVLAWRHVPLAAISACAVGMVAPGMWLARKVNQRQRLLRGALPDALDMLVLCLEGGISLVGAFQRVTGELSAAHPVLGAEMTILEREIQLGLSAGEALKKFSERCGLDDVRELASVLLQSERYGASVVKALRTHAESWRTARQQQAEERAQQAAVKILFPTLLCIFPAIFIVLLGPAALQMAKLFAR